MGTQSAYGERDGTLLSSASLESPGGRQKEDSGRKMGSIRETLSHSVPLYPHHLSLLSDSSFAMGIGGGRGYRGTESSLWEDEHGTG